jgi:hypothetical protein
MGIFLLTAAAAPGAGATPSATNTYCLAVASVGRSTGTHSTGPVGRSRIVAHCAQGKVIGLVAVEPGLRVRLQGNGDYWARYTIDATGRTGALSRLTGGRSPVEDRLVACVVYVADPITQNHELLIETFPDGWWYTASLPHDRRIVLA